MVAALAAPVAAQTTIDWWGWAPAIDTAEEYIAGFNEVYPDVEVRFRAFPYSDYTQALRLGLVANTGPDVYALEPGVITSQFGQFAEDLTPVLEEALGADWAEQINRTGVASFTQDGAVRAIPVQLGAAGMLWYNQEMLEEIGVEPPTDMAEWKAACETIEAAGKTCFVQGAKDNWVNLDAIIAIAQSVQPGLIVDAVEGRASFEDPAMVEALRIWKSLFDDGIMQEGALGVAQYPDARNVWLAQDAAFIMMGTWHANMMSQEALTAAQEAAGLQPENFTAMAVLLPDFAGEGNAAGLYGGADYGLAVNAKSDDAEAARNFAAFLAASDAGATMVAGNSFSPALSRVVFQISDLINPEVQTPMTEEIAANLAEIGAPRQIPYPTINEALANALQAVAAGVQTPEEAAAAVQSVSETVTR
jgi:raffinose/stachyose/melibiose transport system substrate-binding protein